MRSWGNGLPIPFRVCYTGEVREVPEVKPADHDLKRFATRTDLIVGVITAIVLVVTTVWLVLLLF